MASKKTVKGQAKKEGKQHVANKNGRKAEGGSGSSFFTWFMVLALLGVWTSVAVVWFELVDYDDVLARAKEFRCNISEVLQGKLGAYDADGDGDFDVEDAKVLLAPEGSTLDAVLKKTMPAEETPIEAKKKAKTEDDKPAEVAKKRAKTKGLKEKPAVIATKGGVKDDPASSIGEPEQKPKLGSGSEPVVEEEVIPSVVEQASSSPVKEPVEDESEGWEEVAPVDEVMEKVPVNLEEMDRKAHEEEMETEMESVEEPPSQEAPEREMEEDDLFEEETGPETSEDLDEERFFGTADVSEEVDDQDNMEDTIDTEGKVIEEEQFEETVEDPPEDSVSSDPEQTQEADTADDVSAEADDLYGSQSMGVESEIQAAVPLPELEEEDLDSVDGVESDDFEVPPYEDSQEEGVHSNAEETQEPEPVKEELPKEPEVEDLASVDDKTLMTETADEPVQAEMRHQQEPAGATEAQEEKSKEKAKKKKPKLLNKFDKTIKAEIEAAEKLRKKGKIEDAVRSFESLVQKYPQSPRSRFGKAQAEDDLAEKQRSNEMLLKAVGSYLEAAELPDAPDDLVRAALKKRAERQQFLGRMRGALMTLEKLVKVFPDDISLKNDLGVGFLLVGDNKNAKKIYEEVLAVEPNDGFAKVHYGFILKSENQIAESIPFLREGLESGDPGTDDGRFYFHLGDALQRVGDDSAYRWYELGHQRGHFASVWQRSLYNVEGLRAQAWWTPKETGYTDLVKTLERNWRTIRDEALSVMDTTRGLFVPEDENLREKGEWGQFTLWQQGRKVENSCRSVPKTCALLERYPEATGCKRGQIKYSVMQPGTHVWPHTGPTNCRLRIHLGLVIPTQGCRIRCTNQTKAWEEGKVIIFDDSFEHEVWQDANSYRLIFIVDVWHPELTQYQRQTLSPI